MPYMAAIVKPMMFQLMEKRRELFANLIPHYGIVLAGVFDMYF